MPVDSAVVDAYKTEVNAAIAKRDDFYGPNNAINAVNAAYSALGVADPGNNFASLDAQARELSRLTLRGAVASLRREAASCAASAP